MKNKIIKVSFAFLLLCILLAFAASCSEADTINDALENTRELESISADVYFNVYVTHGSLAKRIRAVEHIEGSNDRAVITVGEYEKEGKTVYLDKTSAYFDGYRLNRSEYEKYYGSHTAFTYDLLNFAMDESLFEKAEVSESAGKLKVKKSFDEEEERKLFSEMLRPFFQNIEDRMNNLVRCADCERFSERCKYCALSDVLYEGTSIEIVAKDGYIESIRVKFDMFATLDGVETTMNADIEMNINSFGDAGVEFPSGYESYANYQMTSLPEIEDWFSKK